MEDKQERDFERHKKAREENEVQCYFFCITKMLFWTCPFVLFNNFLNKHFQNSLSTSCKDLLYSVRIVLVIIITQTLLRQSTCNEVYWETLSCQGEICQLDFLESLECFIAILRNMHVHFTLHWSLLSFRSTSNPHLFIWVVLPTQS